MDQIRQLPTYPINQIVRFNQMGFGALMFAFEKRQGGAQVE